MSELETLIVRIRSAENELSKVAKEAIRKNSDSQVAGALKWPPSTSMNFERDHFHLNQKVEELSRKINRLFQS